MLHRRLLLLLLGVVSGAASGAEARTDMKPEVQALRTRPHEVTWSYSGTLNQQLWGQRFPSCNGARQSPIDIDETFAQVQLQYQQLQLEGWERPVEGSRVRNNGKTVLIDVGGELFISGGGLSRRFRVGTISFHWGRCNASSAGSEHSLSGMKYPLEMQIYSYEDDLFGSSEEALSGGGRVAAVAVLFQVGAEENENLAPVVSAVNSVSRFGKSALMEPFSLRSLLPKNTDKYFIYNGSLTAPPCSQTVEWVVLKESAPIAPTQLEMFCEVLTLEKSGFVILTDYLQNNFREQRQDFVGQVFASFTGVEDIPAPICSSEPQEVQAEGQNDTALVVTWDRPRYVFDTSIDRYLVTYQRLQGAPQSPEEYRTDGDQDVGAIIAGLQSNGSYVVQVVSLCTNGLRGRWSDQVIVDMPQEQPESDLDSDRAFNKEDSPGENRDKPKTPKEVYQNLPRPETVPNQSKKPGPESTERNLNSIEEAESGPGGGGPGFGSGPGFEGNGAIWIQEPTEQPGFLFPVARTPAQNPGRRAITEEASLAQTLDPASEDRLTPLSEDAHVTDVFYDDAQPFSEAPPPAPATAAAPDGADTDWVSDREPAVSLVLVQTGHRPFTRASLLRVLGHTTQPMFNGGSNSSHESRVGLVSVAESERGTVVPLAVVSSLTFLSLLVLLGILVYWRNCFQTADFYPEDSTSPKVVSALSTPLLLPPTDGLEPLTVKQFVKHVLERHATNTFSKEFEEVQACSADMALTTDSSNLPENKSKNRYINILAYDHSRVRLRCSPDSGDYINANFVDGHGHRGAYIAAQGPLGASLEDFWRMIWQQNVGVIVMITNLKEKGRTKCEQYWPEAGRQDYGPYQVTLRSSKALAYYTMRTMTLRDSTQSPRGDGHTVLQYHYTQWPDMGVPEYTLPLLSFIRRSSQARTQDMGPLLVHCSAGVGRTGTYIVIDSMLQQIQDQGTVSLLEFLKHIRTQRNFLVQTEEQYVFTHDTLVEAVLSRDTSVTSDLLHSYVAELLTPGPTGRTRMDKQFKLISQRQAKHADYSTALKHGNAERNRARALMPVERSRVCLRASDSNGSGYINASYVMGHHCCREFIMAQTPLGSTRDDFWRLILENDVHTVVSLRDPRSEENLDFMDFRPSSTRPIVFSNFHVTFSREKRVSLCGNETVVVRDFLLSHPQTHSERELREFSAPWWPNHDSPIRNCFDLITAVSDNQEPRVGGAILVHDPLGGPVSGLFCALLTLYHQLQEEGAVDVYLVARMTNLMRPGVFNDMEQFQFLYRSVLSLVSSQEDQEQMQSPETNGTLPLSHSLVSESLESLM